ncbi:MAG: DUF4139 domain-containing protein [Rhodocyclaceae bacterium]|jgi:hypothetical protein|nr:hypothetical protein [Rhodocyclaceae bacterium]MCC6879031.1 DUF4139 domain-containing protein [Rhodocyclaceae bacterium]MCL4680629.1 DUF4139 domain-containing protein [Rhodocyclaceae bacterium]
MNIRTPRRALALALFAAAALHAAAAETVSRAEDRSEVAVTIYNDSLALVKEVRGIAFQRGANSIALRDVSAKMRPETASLRALGGGGLRLVEQNFDFDLLTPQKLLEKYVGRSVTVIKTNPATGAETREPAEVLATNGGVVLKYADRIESGVPGRIAYGSIPPNLRERPTLVVQLESAAAGRQNAELSYLTGGLSWRADYVAELAGDESKLDLAGWVTLTNQSGASYENARLQLVAGDVNRVRDELRTQQFAAKAMAAPPAAEMAREQLFEYHLYSLARPTTILDNQTKQVALLSAAAVPVRKEYRLAGQDWYYRGAQSDLGRQHKVAVFVEFDNKGGELGMPLPKGIVRVYKKDSRGNALFIGEDRIDHTAKNETVRLKLGDAFDVKASRKQTGFRKIADRVYESAFSIELSNAKDSAVTVKVVEPVPGDWEMVAESQKHAKGDAHSAVWLVQVPAQGKATLDYSVRMRW